ncbi:MAG: hypothetical protein HOZ81_53740 [Streptomyces sp.]|nr:hypothetical protein [Streptomyces sp.]
MTIHDTYGTKTHTVRELAGLLAPLLNLTFAEHDSYFRGEYLKAEAGGALRSRSSPTQSLETTKKTTSTLRSMQHSRPSCWSLLRHFTACSTAP